MKHRGLILLASTVLVGVSAGCDSCSKPKADPADAAPVATLIPDAAPLNATTMPLKQIQAVVNREGLAAYAGPTGSVEGTLNVDGVPAPEAGLSSATYTQCPAAEQLYGKDFREGTPEKPDGPRWLADAIVVVTGYAGYFIPEKEEAKLVTIEGCGFSTRTITMTFGQRMEVKNLTKEYWAPELDPRQPGALMMATPGGDPVKIYPKQAGRYHLVDHDRKYVIDDLFVLPQPLHAVTDAKGHYRIDGVPVSAKLKVTATHPRIADVAASREIEVRAGVVTRVDLLLHNKALERPGDAGKDPDAVAPYPGLH